MNVKLRFGSCHLTIWILQLKSQLKQFKGIAVTENKQPSKIDSKLKMGEKELDMFCFAF